LQLIVKYSLIFKASRIMTMHKLIKLNVECRNHVYAKLSKYLKRDQVRKRSLRLNIWFIIILQHLLLAHLQKHLTMNIPNNKKSMFHIYIYIYIYNALG
jgi:hypothetical protein